MKFHAYIVKRCKLLQCVPEKRLSSKAFLSVVVEVFIARNKNTETLFPSPDQAQRLETSCVFHVSKNVLQLFYKYFGSRFCKFIRTRWERRCL